METYPDSIMRKPYFDDKPLHPDKFIHGSSLPQQLVEDDRTGMSVETLKRAFLDHLNYSRGTNLELATPYDCYMALSYTVRDRLMHRWIASRNALHDGKMVCYLSAEFLMGRQLGNNLYNIGSFMQTRKVMQELGLNLYDILEQETEPGLGNGGLGRLAACFLDSLSTLDISAMGYGIRYEYGIFEQCIENGWQVERPDHWLRFGNPWELARPQLSVEVKLGGRLEWYTDQQGVRRRHWAPATTVLGIPYDTMIPGFSTNMVNTLRLWSGGTTRDFDFQIFNEGDYTRAVSEKVFSENISKVLYPNDNTPQGKELRLNQQYFFVSCSLQDILRRHLRRAKTLRNLHEYNPIQLNDTHPSIGIAEMMRLLIDEHYLDWDTAWKITTQSFAYTNHTLLSEALETWPVELFERILPRHLEIIYEINRRFLEIVAIHYPGDNDRLGRMSIIEEGPEKRVRMAHLATVGSHAVNGVAQIHTELLKRDVLRDFCELWPQKISNKTNGITPRRWLMLCNPKLAFLISEQIGKGWIKDLGELRKLEPLVGDSAFRETWKAFKSDNKRDLAEYILHYNGVRVDPDSLFDIQVKRLHEYKRQLLSVLHIVHLYNQLRANPHLEITPRTFIFGAKAAPGYRMAKLIIKLINSVADVVNSDPLVNHKMKVVFLANFCVSLGERVYPAADLSEQISLAGKEATGTGNMKFSLNGALTIGTLDGANIEIREAVGEENFFLCGLTVSEVKALKASGYYSRSYYENNAALRAAIDLIASGHFSENEPQLFHPIVDSLINYDEYLLLADFQSYMECQEQVGKAYADIDHWTTMSILNVARIGKFSSDRTIREYCEEIWGAKPIQVVL
jgi:glycogen phosphorylase